MKIICEEAKRTPRITFNPGWAGDTAKDKARVTLGSRQFEATADTGSGDPSCPTFILPANAQIVTAMMVGRSVSLELQSDGQKRIAPESDDGVFQVFGTTCAQINGMR